MNYCEAKNCGNTATHIKKETYIDDEVNKELFTVTTPLCETHADQINRVGTSKYSIRELTA